METEVRSPVSEVELHLLTAWESDPARSRDAGLASVVVHAVAIGLLLLLPKQAFVPTHAQRHVITPLIAPPTELTQKAPNKGKLSKEIYAETVQPRPAIQIPPSAPPSTTRRAATKFTPPPVARPGPSAAPLPEPPKAESSQMPAGTPPVPQIAPVAPPPQIQAQEKPKIVLESPSSQPVGRPGGHIAVPNSSVGEAIKSVQRGGSGGIMVGDSIGGDIGGIGEGINLPPTPGRTGGNLELLSDPMGVDFRPYLTRILVTVKRNWLAVIPESAKLGRRGRVAIQFAIDRNGGVPKLVIVAGSGADALDRAAVAGISASNPFPPLPTEYKGNQVRVQFNFAYNMPR